MWYMFPPSPGLVQVVATNRSSDTPPVVFVRPTSDRPPVAVWKT